MRSSINLLYSIFPRVIVAKLEQAVDSDTKDSAEGKITAQNFKMFLQGIDGSLEANIVAGTLFQAYICTTSIPEIELKKNNQITLTDGRKFQVNGVLLQDSNPLIHPFYKLEINKI